mmetsp:Transcript_17803/g.41520  ORF Transcript_17803/g.41520 Transcript_17803/m.41520 type:complete len:260 (+) Transcript_17803:1519-2298(+)
MFLRDPLVLWLGVKNVVVTLERRTRPDERLLEAFGTRVVKIRDEYLVINESAHLPRLHKMDRIEVGDVDGLLIGKWVVVAVFVYVQRKQDYVYSVYVLKNDDALAPVKEFVRVILIGVPLLHQLANFVLPVRRRNLADGDGATRGQLFVCSRVGHILRVCLLACQHVHPLLDLLMHVSLQPFAELRSGYVARGRRRREWVRILARPLPLLEDALRARIRRGVVLVVAGVIKAADLVYPPLAVVALDPTLLVNLVVLTLR